MSDTATTLSASDHSDEPAAWQRGLAPAVATDRKIAGGLSVGALIILYLFFMDWFTFVPVPTYGQGGPTQTTEYFQNGLLLLPLFVGLFLTIFMKSWTARILTVLFLGIPFALIFPVVNVDEAIPGEVAALFGIPLIAYLLVFLVSILYLGNFGVRLIRGRDTRPSLKSVSLQTVLALILLLILFAIS